MNSKWSMAVVCAGLAVVVAKAPAQERVTEVTATELTLQEPLESGGVAAVGTAEMMTYQGYAEKAGAAINNQSMVVELRAFTALTGGTQRGVTVSQALLPSEVYKGSFAFDFDAALLALPDNADETYLEVAICSPDPCIPVPLVPRRLITHSPLAASARSLQGAAYATDLGALMVAGNGDNAGILKAQADVSGVTQELRLDAQAATVAVARQDNTPTALKMRTSTADRSFELSLDNLTGDMMLTRVEPSATAAVRTITSALGLNHYFRVTDSAGPAPLSLESWSPDGGKTYMLLNDGAKEITLGGVYAAASTAGVTPPPKLQVSLAGPGVAMAAFSGPSASAFDFKYGAQSAMRVGEDPAAAGQAMMLVGPQGLFLSDTALATDQNAAAAVPTGVKISVVHFLNESAQGETALAAAPTLQIQSVFNSVPTTIMKIDGDTGKATVYGPCAVERRCSPAGESPAREVGCSTR